MCVFDAHTEKKNNCVKVELGSIFNSNTTGVSADIFIPDFDIWCIFKRKTGCNEKEKNILAVSCQQICCRIWKFLPQKAP